MLGVPPLAGTVDELMVPAGHGRATQVLEVVLCLNLGTEQLQYANPTDDVLLTGHCEHVVIEPFDENVPAAQL
jgi:hypothetical protein